MLTPSEYERVREVIEGVQQWTEQPTSYEYQLQREVADRATIDRLVNSDPYNRVRETVAVPMNGMGRGQTQGAGEVLRRDMGRFSVITPLAAAPALVEAREGHRAAFRTLLNQQAEYRRNAATDSELPELEEVGQQRQCQMQILLRVEPNRQMNQALNCALLKR
jgi:hypothetical protein